MHSLHETTDSTCECGATVKLDRWLIIDASECPEGVNAIRDFATHYSLCGCGTPVVHDSPLLFLDTRFTPGLLFSPAGGTSPKKNLEHANALVSLLRDRMGDAWKAAWIADGLPFIARRDLTIALRTHTLRLLDPEDPGARDKHRFALLAKFRPNAMADWPHVVQDAPDTLSDEFDAFLEVLIVVDRHHEPLAAGLKSILRLYLNATRMTGDPHRWFQVIEAGLDDTEVSGRIRKAHRTGADPAHAAEEPPPLTSLDANRLAQAYRLSSEARALGNFRDCGPRGLQKKIDLLEQVITCPSLRSLAPWDHKAFCCELAHVYRIRKRGSRSANLARAERLFAEVSRDLSRHCFPETWAGGLSGRAWTLIEIGGRKRLREAVTACHQALMVYDEREKKEEHADLQHALGEAYAGLAGSPASREAARAEEHLQKALTRGDALRRSDVAHIHATLAALLAGRSNAGDPAAWALERRHLECAAELYAAVGQRSSETTALKNLARRAQAAPGDKVRNLQQAIALAEQVLSREAETADPGFRAFAAWLMMEQGRISTAIDICEGALSHPSSRTSKRDSAALLNTLGVAYYRLQTGDRAHNLERSIGHLLASLRCMAGNPPDHGWAATHHNLCNSWRERRTGDARQNLARAIAHGRAALRVRRRAAHPRDWAATQNSLALAYRMRTGDRRGRDAQRAIASYRAALSVRRHELTPYEWATSAEGLGSLLGSAGDGTQKVLQEAVALSRGAMVTFRAIGATSEWPRAAVNLTLVEAGSPTAKSRWAASKRARLLREAAGAAASAGDPETATFAALTLGDHYFERRRWTNAAVAYGQALARLSLGYGAAHSHAGWRHVAGRIAGAGAKRVYALAKQGLTDEAVAERERTSALRLRAVFDPSEAGAVRLDRPIEENATSVAPQPSDDVLVLVPVVTEAGTTVLVRRPGRSGYGRIDIPEFTRGTVNGLVVDLLAPRRGKTPAKILERLRQQFARSLVERLGPGPFETVLITPHDGLGLLPLQAALAECGGPFAESSFVHAPSLQVFRGCRERTTIAGGPPRVLALINPTGDLPFASVEAAMISTALGDGDRAVLNGPEATCKGLSRRLTGVSHIHVAAHGEHSWRDPLESRLLLADRPFTTADVLRLDLSGVRLVVLSACETGLSDMKARNEHFGLHTAFLEAGAAAVIATLWPVSDLSTALLMQRFYREHLVEGHVPATALRIAQAWLRDLDQASLFELLEPHVETALAGLRGPGREGGLQGGSRPFADPHYWAGFVLWGS